MPQSIYTIPDSSKLGIETWSWTTFALLSERRHQMVSKTYDMVFPSHYNENTVATIMGTSHKLG